VSLQVEEDRETSALSVELSYGGHVYVTHLHSFFVHFASHSVSSSMIFFGKDNKNAWIGMSWNCTDNHRVSVVPTTSARVCNTLDFLELLKPSYCNSQFSGDQLCSFFQLWILHISCQQLIVVRCARHHQVVRSERVLVAEACARSHRV
jgi:hypothetical protein